MKEFETKWVTVKECSPGKFSVTSDGLVQPSTINGNAVLELMQHLSTSGWTLMATIDRSRENGSHIQWDMYFRRTLSE